MDSEGERKLQPQHVSSSQEDKNPKRKMKTPEQLELLEKTYAADNYPPEHVRSQLSERLKLSDRQLQMWFCHRRLKDKKEREKEKERETEKEKEKEKEREKEKEKQPKKEKAKPAPALPPPPPPPPPPLAAPAHSVSLMPTATKTNFYDDYDARKRPPLKLNCEGGGGWKKKSQPQNLQLHPTELLRAIAAVEAQLGEPLREDGPILGVEFDQLPPGAFGSPIVALTGQLKQGGHHYEKLFDRQDAKSNKRFSVLQNDEHTSLPAASSGKRKAAVGSMPTIHPQPGTRAPQEYQFLPEQPSGRRDPYDRLPPSSFYENPFEVLGPSAPPLSTAGNFLHGRDHLTAGYSFQNQVSNPGLLSQEGRSGHAFSQGGIDYEGLQHKDCFTGFSLDGQFGSHQTIGAENAYLQSDKRALYQDQNETQIEKKRKSEDARIAKEVEAHAKRFRKELERQEIMKRKMEEQMRKEREKQDREKRKEEERKMREMQREAEKMQKEHRRTIERMARKLEKENQRAEKMRHKEDLRREKEAARQRAANERATARKLARESMELIDDERLELMEAAASAKGLSSIFLLDSETLQELESYKDTLGKFPATSVKMKRPFAVRPWTDSEQNVGNLFMVWRFIVTFADVLGLWPFTLDEFVQAFHDYEPRLLGEIHISLLKTIVKDIEDVAQATSNGLGANQNSISLAGGGHPQLVEAAFAWGFDIREWHRHLNPLTWPEVLRQFALAAGFGPQWKKRKSVQERPRDENEGHERDDAVSTLRSGAAAANAVAMMQGKGSGNMRRCKYRLTPGTVKYAAFHVLSLEGSKGLTILEVADRIQKSGLRDLSTSKTPEASIAAALSRDANLFERVAPSTYCVRPAFRKDPCDADAVLQAAREKIQLFQSGFSDSEEADKDTEDVEEVERDEDYDCDVEDADADADDLDDPVNSGKVIFCLKEGKVVQAPGISEKEKHQKMDPCSGGSVSPAADNVPKVKSSAFVETAEDAKGQEEFNDSFSIDGDSHKGNHMKEETEIDENHIGEPWVQGLMEGEYSDLSVEERLNALVCLIGVANEGNTIRVVLEERLEAANALKRQMWAEAQSDRRRIKEEQLSRAQALGGIKSEGTNANLTFEGGQSPFVGMDIRGTEASVFSQPKCEASADLISVPNHLSASANSNAAVEKCLPLQENSFMQDTSVAQQTGYTTEKSRAQLKASIGLKAEELYVYRSIPLGQDRRHNRYWQFVTCSSGNDPGSGRIFFESHEDGHWKVIDTAEAFDALLASLDIRGVREAHLHAVLQKLESPFKQAVKTRSALGKHNDVINGLGVKTEISYKPSCPGYVMEDGNLSASDHDSSDSSELSRSFTVELGRNNAEKVHVLERYKDFEKWLWRECLESSSLRASKLRKKRGIELLRTCEACHEVYWSRDKHCSCCHGTFESSRLELKFSQHVLECEEKRRRNDTSWRLQGPTWSFPSRIQLLKAVIAAVEVAIPSEALKPFWTEGYRRSWGLTLRSVTSPAELLQITTQLEGAVNRDWLSSNFETTKELLGVISPETGVNESNFVSGEVPLLPWIPHTTAAVALRLMVFDYSLAYSLDQKPENQTVNEYEDINNMQSNVASRTVQHLEACENVSPIEEDKREDTGTDSGNGRNIGRGRGRVRGRGRGRGGRSITTRTEIGLDSVNRDSKRKLQFSEDGTSVTNEDQKKVRGRTRRGRARGRGRGRVTRSSKHRQLGMQRSGEKEKDPNPLTNIRMGMQNKPEEMGEDDDLSECSQSIEGEEWEGQDGFREAGNHGDQHYNEEDNVSESSEEEEDIDEACENGQDTEDEFEDEDAKYEDDYFARDGEAEESEAGEAAEVDAESEDESEDDDDEESTSVSSKNSD